MDFDASNLLHSGTESIAVIDVVKPIQEFFIVET